MSKRLYDIVVVVSVLMILLAIAMVKPVTVYGATMNDEEGDIVEIVVIYDEDGNRGTATISHRNLTFDVEVVMPDGETITVKNWRTANYNLDDVKAVDDRIHCVGIYYPPKYSKYKITRSIFLKAGL